jgi:hypothetical protein
VHVSESFDDLFAFENNQYYVEVKVFRDKSSVDATVFGVAVRLAQI